MFSVEESNEKEKEITYSYEKNENLYKYLPKRMSDSKMSTNIKSYLNLALNLNDLIINKKILESRDFSFALNPVFNAIETLLSELISDKFYDFLYKLYLNKRLLNDKNRFNINTRFVKKYIDRMYKREVIRLFGNAKFDKVIHFTGYEKRITGLLERFDAKRAIFVHNDMVSELKTKGNQHYKTLKEAYNNYDRVVAVSEDIIEPIKKISGRDDNIVVVNNAHDYKAIIEKSKKEIAYSETTVANVSEKILKKLLDMDYIKFINIARYSPEKGQKRLIDAFEKFYKKHENSLLIIIGGYGKLYDELHEYIKHLDCRYNVILIKSIDNPFPILKKCDLFILSSFYEALGLVLLEADTCKVPCFSTDVRGPRGFMKKYGGTLVENSEEGILKGMNDFMDGKIKCMNFDAEKYNEKVKQEYENIFK